MRSTKTPSPAAESHRKSLLLRQLPDNSKEGEKQERCDQEVEEGSDYGYSGTANIRLVLGMILSIGPLGDLPQRLF
jgi:hypothetical protein